MPVGVHRRQAIGRFTVGQVDHLQFSALLVLMLGLHGLVRALVAEAKLVAAHVATVNGDRAQGLTARALPGLSQQHQQLAVSHLGCAVVLLRQPGDEVEVGFIELTDRANPRFGVRRNKEPPRDYYAGDIVWDSVYAQAVQELKDAMASYLTGQRPADALKLATTDMSEGFLRIGQGKTEKRLRILLEDADKQSDLSVFLEKLKERRSLNRIKTSVLITNASGLRMSQQMLRNRWDEARERPPSKRLQMEIALWQSASGNFSSGTFGQKRPVRSHWSMPANCSATLPRRSSRRFTDASERS